MRSNINLKFGHANLQSTIAIILHQFETRGKSVISLCLHDHVSFPIAEDMEYSIMNSTDDFFTGMDETIAALSSTKIKYILYWERKYINSATYR